MDPATLALARANEVWVPVTLLSPLIGSPVIMPVANRFAAGLFDADASEFMVAVLRLPSHWEKLSVDLHWTSAAAAPSGNVSWSVDIAEFADGDNLNITPLLGGNSVVAAPAAQYALKVDTITFDVSVATSKMTLFRVRRVGESGSDTMTGDAALLGLMLRRA